MHIQSTPDSDFWRIHPSRSSLQISKNGNVLRLNRKGEWVTAKQYPLPKAQAEAFINDGSARLVKQRVRPATTEE